MHEKSFMQKYIDGEADFGDIDDYIGRWHDGKGDPDHSLAKFLGLTDAQYKLFAESEFQFAWMLHDMRNQAAKRNRKDSERLDWLELVDGHVEWRMTSWTRSDCKVSNLYIEGTWKPSIREAIDAAMREEREAESATKAMMEDQT